MTLGINNGIIIMEADNEYDFEFNMQPYQGQCLEQNKLLDWKAQQRGYHLKKAMKIVTKYYYRSFIGRFKSAVYQMLVQNITRQTQIIQTNNQIDWPYRSLLLKPNKNEHQLLQIQFINMCAEKIQAVFKGYLTRKRFKVAFGKAKKFMGTINALVKGWKIRRIMRCIKIKQQIKSIQIKRGEVDKEEKNSTTNKFNLRRLQYLKNSLKTEIVHFHNHFNELYATGAWVYEPKIEIPRIKIQKWSDKKKVIPMKQNQFNQSELQTVEFTPEVTQQPVPQKKKRVRQMRNNVRKAKNQEGSQQQQPSQDQLKNQSTYSMTTTTNTNNGDERPIQAKGSYNATISQDRPIQAKGAYSFNQESMPPISVDAKETKGQQNNTQDEERKIQLQKIQKKKLEKRKKYDPRKAIQQQKKRKQQQQAKEKQEQVKSPTDIALPKLKTEQHKSKQQNTKSQKLIKLQKEQSNRSTVNFPKSKAKVQAKIDCWGNRKTVTKKNAQEFIKATKIISNTSEILQPVVEKNIELIPSEKLAAKIHQRRGKQKEKLEYSQQREKARIEIQKNCQQSQRIKQYLQLSKQHEARESQAAKYLKAQSLRERQKVVVQQSTFEEQKDKRKDAVYRSVAELAQTYRTQYLTRYQNLHPKLNLLAAARNTEQSSRIPVLSLESEFVERMMEQNKLNQRFWYTVSKMERTFKDFVKS